MNRASFYTEEKAVLEGVVSWQELSRRYVSGKKSEFEFYISPKLKHIESSVAMDDEDSETIRSSTHGVIGLALAHYNEAIAQGIKPEEARRILPQSMYTTIYSAWMPSQLDVFYKLRLDSHAQYEIRELAAGMRQLA